MTAFAPGRARLTFGYGSTRSDRSWSRERLESARMVSRPAATQGQLVGGRWHLCCPPSTSSAASPPTAAHVDKPGAPGIRPEQAAAIVRRYGSRTRRAPQRGRMWQAAEICEARMEPPIVALSANGSILPVPESSLYDIYGRGVQ